VYSEAKFEDAGIGTESQGLGAVMVVLFNKSGVLDQLNTLRTTQAADGSALWLAADDAPEAYFSEIDAHVKTKKTRGDGTAYYEYIQIQEHDHFGDCEAMQVVAANMAGFVGADFVQG
jgi:hypothetical protein